MSDADAFCVNCTQWDVSRNVFNDIARAAAHRRPPPPLAADAAATAADACRGRQSRQYSVTDSCSIELFIVCAVY